MIYGLLKEASASGLPAVATWHGGIPEIVEHERTGLLVPERSVEDLGQALERLLADPAGCIQLGRAGREKMLSGYDNRQRVAELEERLLAVSSHGVTAEP